MNDLMPTIVARLVIKKGVFENSLNILQTSRGPFLCLAEELARFGQNLNGQKLPFGALSS